MTVLQSFRIWPRMALRFILRHRRKTIATAGFIVLGTGILVFLHALTVGINDTMVLNTTRLHHGDLFAEIPAGIQTPEVIAAKMAAASGVSASLFRCRFPALLTSGADSSPAVLFGVNPGAESSETAIASRITAGEYPEDHSDQVLLGCTLADTLDVKVWDSVSVVESSGAALGELSVSGIYRTEIPHFDNLAVYDLTP